MIKVTIDVSKELSDSLKRMENPDWQKIYSGFMDVNSKLLEKYMNSQITVDGANYLPLSPAYRKRKQRERGNLPILVYTGRLKRAISNPNSGDFDYRVSGSNLQYGINIPYGGYVHEKRPFLAARNGINEEQFKALKEVYLKYIETGDTK